MSEFFSRVYTDRPAYADFDSAQKFLAIQGIIARRLREHPNAICSYSGGSDSDIMIDMIERTRDAFKIPPITYCFFNTGLEMMATKRHVKDVERKYGVTITEYRPKKKHSAVHRIMAKREISDSAGQECPVFLAFCVFFWYNK